MGVVCWVGVSREWCRCVVGVFDRLWLVWWFWVGSGLGFVGFGS